MTDEKNVARATEKRINHRKEKQNEENVIATEVQKSAVQNDVWRFVETANDVPRKTAPSPVMCKDSEGNMLTDKTIVPARRKEHFKYLLKRR